MKDLRNKVAAVTGAASGIGRALAVELAGHGTHLALSDVDEVGLAATVEAARKKGVTVTSARLDVADREAFQAWADHVVAEHGRANLIINNAGVAIGATVEGMSWEDYDWLMGINLGGVVNGTKAFLPHLRAAGEGHVVNISSVFGLMGIPSQSAYNAAKFGVRGFTEALRIELDLLDDGVSCTTIHPGGIKTNIARNARMSASVEALGMRADEAAKGLERMFFTTPTRAAKVIVKAVQADKRRAMIGPDAHLFNLMAKLPPAVYQRMIAQGSRRA